MTEFDLLSDRGSSLLEAGDTAGALECFSRAKRLAQQEGREAELCGMLGDMAVAFRRVGNDKAAINTYRDAIELCRRHGDALNLSRWLSNLVALYTRSGDLAKAEPLLDEMLQAAVRTGRQDQLGVAAQAVGAYLSSTGRHREAVEYLQRAAREVKGDSMLEDIVRKNLVTVQLTWGEELARANKIPAAAACLRAGLELVDASYADELRMSIRARVVLAQLEEWRGDQPAFIAELQAARETAVRLGDQDTVAALNQALAKAGVT